MRQVRKVRTVRGVFWITVAAVVTVFCVVQDRVTADGARRYVALQDAALEGRGRPVTIDDVMRPAVDRSVRLALWWSGAVAALGAAAGAAVRRASRRAAALPSVS
ncbi:MAG: hypothetical protein ACRD26_22620 [Vicinamibacterales bacterium]